MLSCVSAIRSNHLLRAVLLLLLAFQCTAASAQLKEDQARIDSIFRAIPLMRQDTNTVRYINKVYFDYLWKFDLPESYSKLKYALTLSKRLDYIYGEYITYNNMAGYCMHFNSLDYSLKNRVNALAAAARMKDSLRMATQWFGMGMVYHGMGKDKEALSHFLTSKPLIEASRDKDKIARVYSQLGALYHSLGRDSIGIDYMNRSLQLRKEINYTDGIMASLVITRQIYLENKQYDKVLEYTEEVRKVEESRNNKSGVAGAYVTFGNVANLQNEPGKAIGHFNKAIEIAREIDDKAVLRDAYSGLAAALDRSGDKLRAYNYFKLHVQLKDSLAAVDVKKKVRNLEELLDVESKNHEIELLSKDKEIGRLELEKKEEDLSSQQKRMWGLGGMLLVTASLAGLIFAGYRQKKRTARNLALQKDIIEEKSRVIEDKNKDILDSIRYAEKIQHAMQPSQKLLAQVLPDSFVLYKPKDIVSGDFYWFTQKGNYVFIAAADCTGHGVPGALMSMIGLNFLNQIVNERGIEDTGAILDELHRNVLSALNDNLEERDSKDGMDIALLRIDTAARVAQFSGAVRPLCYTDGNGLKVIKGDRYSIGGIKSLSDSPFTSTLLHLTSTTTFYLFSDGYADQFGGSSGKKFMMKKFQGLLEAVHHKPMNEQKKELDTAIEQWKGTLEQVDDILVIGARV
jgi:serine phosphatase RsbU (regulator of sigma subunit)/tetratricopeptide (TPR) repeat protein